MDLTKLHPNTAESEVLATLSTGKVAKAVTAVPMTSGGDELFTVAKPGQIAGSLTATVSTIAEVTNNKNVESVDLVDAVTEVANVTSVDLIDLITRLAEVTLVGQVSEMPAAVQGPGNPVIDSYTDASVTLSANTANQVIVAAPGNSKQIWVYALVLLADTDAGTIALQDEDDAAISGAMAVSDEGGFALSPSGNFAMPLFKVPTNKALEADTVTCSAAGFISYAVVSV
jgi:hypothetical protein